MFRYSRTLFSFTRKASSGKTTPQPFNRSTNEISATEISPTQMGIAFFGIFVKVFKRDATLGALNMFKMFKRDVGLFRSCTFQQ
jgi:hypothetical protein